METIDDLHLQFANYFRSKELAPFIYLLSQQMAQGSTCIVLPEMNNYIKENFPFNIQNYSIKKLENHPLVSYNKSSLNRPFVYENERLYLQRYFLYEVQLIERIKSFIGNTSQKFTERIENILRLKGHLHQLFPYAENKIDWQKTAACIAFLNDFTIITGGPGTGKTTTVAKIIELFFLQNPLTKIALAAPTGKAAARMSESLKNVFNSPNETIKNSIASLKPSTIHRLLGTIKDSIYFKYNNQNPLHYDVVIIDESSMIDIGLFYKLLSAIGNNTRLILLGDKNQLSSVEVGSFFGDLCKTVTSINHYTTNDFATIQSIVDFAIPTIEDYKSDYLQNNIVELKESRRFDKNKGIGKLADAVIHNDTTTLQHLLTSHEESQLTFDFTNADIFWKNFSKKYIDYIAETDIRRAIIALDKCRILCAVREGEYGTYTINRKIEIYLQNIAMINCNTIYYENRPIMVVENNYELGLYNGDIGILRKDEDGIVKAWFLDTENEETGLKSILPGLIKKMETVFAMTIHKSQGSEFDEVMVILPPVNKYEQLLTREILYTAITRAKESVYIMASEQNIMDTINRQVQRSSGVNTRI